MAGGLKAKEVFPGVFSRHARAYRDRVMASPLGGRAEVVERLAPRPGDRVLDLACGPGTLTLVLAARVGPGGQVVAGDLASGMLDLLRKAAPANVEVRLLDLEGLDLPAADFDAAACGHGYQFVSDLDAALAEARRVLRPGGRFAASLPDGGASRGVRALIERALEGLPPAPPVSDRAATLGVIRDRGRLAAAVRRAGFREVAVTRHEEQSEYATPEVLTQRTFAWWDCAWRIEQLEPVEQARARDRYRDFVAEHVREWPVRTTSYTLVVSGLA